MLGSLTLSITIILVYLIVAHYISYQFGKQRILKTQTWDLNICCGKTDGGGINADIVQHKELPNFRLIDNIYALPFNDNEFDSVLCSHTIEHVEDPVAFYSELRRVGKTVTVVVPPLYDLAAVLNIMEHKWIFLSIKKSHQELPTFVKLPFGAAFQERFGQRNHA